MNNRLAVGPTDLVDSILPRNVSIQLPPDDVVSYTRETEFSAIPLRKP